MSFTNRTLFHILTRDGVLIPGRALDLGCGNGTDAVNLVRAGFSVTMVDRDATALKIQSVPPETTFTISNIEDYKIKENEYNLISCQYVLHFLSKKNAAEVIERMVAGALPLGVISFNVLGEKDEWKNIWTTWTREEMETLLSRLPIRIHKMIIEEGNGMTRKGIMKYWHVLNFILIKKEARK